MRLDPGAQGLFRRREVPARKPFPAHLEVKVIGDLGPITGRWWTGRRQRGTGPSAPKLCFPRQAERRWPRCADPGPRKSMLPTLLLLSSASSGVRDFQLIIAPRVVLASTPRSDRKIRVCRDGPKYVRLRITGLQVRALPGADQLSELICGRFCSPKWAKKIRCSAIYPPLWILCDGLGIPSLGILLDWQRAVSAG